MHVLCTRPQACQLCIDFLREDANRVAAIAAYALVEPPVPKKRLMACPTPKTPLWTAWMTPTTIQLS